MNKYIYFIIGYIAAITTIFMASCTFSPLEASGSVCGDYYNPCYVKIVE
jgi:hypothetical protein